MVRSVLVLGSGSAGFLAALTLKRRMADLSVTILRTKEIGNIQAGEASTPTLGFHLHHYCGLDLDTFYRMARPLWKIGTRLEWGPRPFFNHVFGFELDDWSNLLPHGTGYYLDNSEAFEATGVQSSLMNGNKIWLREEDGSPRLVADEFAYQLESEKFSGYLECMAKQRGIPIVDDVVTEVLQDDQGVSGLRSGPEKIITADLYVDTSGCLLGKALAEPFCSYNDSLFCDRAVVGGWDRGREPIKPYTTAETMSSGWCWQIEHEQRVRRGYVYASSFISDSDAEGEFRRANPKVQSTRMIRFRSGRHARFWVKNVVGIGSAAFHVEPLEDTALAFTCTLCQTLADVLADHSSPANDATIRAWNCQMGRGLDAIRDFLAMHYRFNRRLDTPFWRECLASVELHGAGPAVEFYQRNGPSTQLRKILPDRTSRSEFGLEGYLALLVGQCVPYRSTKTPSKQDRHIWAVVQQAIRHKVATAFTVPEALALVRSDSWVWPQRLYDRRRMMRT